MFQNRTLVTALVFALVSVIVWYASQNAKAFDHPTAAQTLALAQDLTGSQFQSDTGQDFVQPAGGVGYPLVIAALAGRDAKLASAIACHRHINSCDAGAFKSLFALQYGLALISLLAIFLAAWVASRSWSIAVITLIFAFIAGSYGALAGQVSPLIWPQTLMLVFLLFATLATTRDDVRWTLAAGLTLGVATLFLPQLLIVGLISAVSFSWFGRLLNLKHPSWHALSMVAGLGFAIVSVLRSYPGTHLISVIEMQVMGGLEARGRMSGLDGWNQLSLLLSPLPIIGKLLQSAFTLNSAEHIDVLATQTRAVGSFVAHVMATPGLFVRGLWAGTPILSVLGLLHIWPLLKFAREDLRFGPVLIVVIPTLALVLVNTLLTVNRPETNVGLVFLYALATAYLIGRNDVRRMFWADKDRGQAEVAAA